MKLLTLLLLSSLSICLLGQENTIFHFPSKSLQETRAITIHIPSSYKSSEKSYPVIYALDGEYTQFALNATMDYYSYWDKIPECIVVSIDQNYADTSDGSYKRWSDCSYHRKTGFINEKGERFKDFITEELTPYIDSKYRTTNFKSIIGHSFTANYVNYFLFDEKPLFSGYIAISPYFAKSSLDSLAAIVKQLTSPIFYYVAHGENDLSGHIKSVNNFDNRFKKSENEFFNYKKFNIKNNQATHSTIFPIAIPYAIEFLFSDYSAISQEEFKKILKIENKYEYLIKRYINIEQSYGVPLPIREEDINITAHAIATKKQWKQLKKMADMAIHLYPESLTGFYLLGDYYKEKKEYALALEQYEIGFSKLGKDILNIEVFQEPIDNMKSKMK